MRPTTLQALCDVVEQTVREVSPEYSSTVLSDPSSELHEPLSCGDHSEAGPLVNSLVYISKPEKVVGFCTSVLNLSEKLITRT